MSVHEQPTHTAAQELATTDPVPTVLPYTGEAPAPAPHVLWIPAAALQLVAGGIVGFLVPFSMFVVGPSGDHSVLMNQLIWIAVSLISAAFVALIFGGVPLLAAWITWLIVSRRHRRLRNEMFAVVLGAIGGALILSALTVLAVLSNISDATGWLFLAIQLLIFGGIPGLAFALWVAAAWRSARKRAALSTDIAVAS
jgi:hypothetical protein